MNLIILRGLVGQDPKITEFSDGGKVANFSLATTDRGFITKDGKEVKESTQWHNIVVKKSGLAKVCEQYVKKGTPLLISGKVTYRSYDDNNGVKRVVTEILVDELELLGNGNKENHEPAPAPEPQNNDKDDMPF